MSAKLTIEYISAFAEKEGYTLLSTEYVNNKKKLDFLCPDGHNFLMRWDHFSRDCRCPTCAGNVKKTIGEIQSFIEKEGYILLSTEYVNGRTLLDFLCPKEHKFKMRWNNFSRGSRCPTCVKRKKTIEEIQSFIEKEGYILLSTKYVNNSTFLDFLCPDGHNFPMTWEVFSRGCRCPTCAGNVKKTIEEIQSFIEKEGYILLSTEYINGKTKLDFLCPKEHKFKMRWNDFSNGRRCSTCSMEKTNSKGVRKIIAYLQEHLIEFTLEHKIHECRNKKQLPFDFHLTQSGVLIEYHGEQHYRIGYAFGATDKEKVFKDQQLRDQIKQEYCTQSGIPLLIIPYTDKNIEETISNFLENLGVTQSSSAIRLCEEEKEENKASVAWSEENHTISMR